MSFDKSSCNISIIEKYASHFDCDSDSDSNQSDTSYRSDGTFVDDTNSIFEESEARSSIRGSYTDMNGSETHPSIDSNKFQHSVVDTSTKQSNSGYKAPETHYRWDNDIEIPYTCPKTRGESCTDISHRPTETVKWQDAYLSPSEIEQRDALYNAQRNERIRRMNMSTGEKVEEFIRNVPDDCKSTFDSCKSRVISAIHNLTGAETDTSDHTT